MAKNLTLAIDEDLLAQMRIVAAKRRTSVNVLVRDYFKQMVVQDSGVDIIADELVRLSNESTAELGDWRPSREDTYSGEARFDR
jgi:hypothetical protein